MRLQSDKVSCLKTLRTCYNIAFTTLHGSHHGVFLLLSSSHGIAHMGYNGLRIVPRFRRVYGIKDKLAGETSISVGLLYIYQ